MRRRSRFVVAILAMVALSPPALAQDVPEPPQPAPAPRAKVIAVGAAEARGGPATIRGPVPAVAETLRIALNKSAEIALPGEVKDIVVGNPDIADVMVRSPTLVYLTGRAAGQTNVFLLDRQGRVLRRIEVDVHIDASAVRDVLAQVMPEERKITVSAVADSIYLSGSVRNDAAAATARNLARRFVANDANLVNLLRVSNDQQVLLHVKVAEMQKTVLKELGVGVATNKAQVLDRFGLTGSTSRTVGFIDTSNIFGSATITGIGQLTTSLSLLESQGLVKTLVEPNLTAVSGETANMLAGGELPIPVSDSNGAISIEFKPFGVLLTFTPTVLDPGRLSLKMSTEVSAIDSSISTAISSTISVPSFKVRRASTTAELPSGGSIMIAGLLQNDVTSNMAGLPGLMDLPVLGALFRSSAFQRKETELVVIMTAYVVQPVEKPELALPTDGFAPSSDIDRFLFGRLQETYTKRSATPPPVPAQLQGPIGYIVQ